jgi:acetyl-CoA C-acetyltransferase
VLVGLGEVVHRPPDPAPEPAALMAEAVRAALADAGVGDALLHRAVLGVVPSAAWPDGDPGRRVNALLGVERPTLRSSLQGGNGPQLLVNALAERIQAGQCDAAIVCGAEALSTLSRCMKAGERPNWPEADGERSGETLEGERAAGNEAETAVGMIAPITAYPLIEHALRLAAGRSPAEQLERISRVWSRFSAVAAQQPAAWSHRTYSAEEIATPSPANRRVTDPYTKLLNAHIQVDQAAAVVLCSVATARALGVPAERWGFVPAGAAATDEWVLSKRHRLDRSPAIAACGQALFAHAGTGPHALGPIDLYSCFPAAVELGAQELGLPFDDPARPLTCTGGLTFFGGPGNNYATHGIIAVARALRTAPAGELGLATALGWYATKHALGLYGNAPPERPFAALRPEPEPVPPRAVAAPLDAEAQAETGTVIFDRAGTPAYGILFALLPDGRRAAAKTDDPEVLAAMVADEVLGRPVRLRADRTFTP